jgi:hypothetical protein
LSATAIATSALTYKSDVGTLVYPGPGSLLTHAVQYVTGTVNPLVNSTSGYDAAVNLTTEKTDTTG